MSAGKSIFSRIIAGEIPCHRVFENAHVLAFLDIHPLAPGHTLVVPKREVDLLDQLTPEEIGAVARVLGPLARRIVQVTGAAGYNILQNNGVAAGQEVRHVHFHIIPRRVGDGLGYRWNARESGPDDLAALAAKIAAEASIGGGA